MKDGVYNELFNIDFELSVIFDDDMAGDQKFVSSQKSCIQS